MIKAVEDLGDGQFQVVEVPPTFKFERTPYFRPFIEGEDDRFLPFNERVNAKRDQLLAAGTTVTVTAYATPIPVQCGLADMSALIDLRLSLSDKGGGPSKTAFRDRNNVVHQLTTPQIFELWLKSGDWVRAIKERSWLIKDTMDPATTDLDDPATWNNL